MKRLIDADKLIEEMSKWYWDKEKQKASEEDVSPMDLFTHFAITTVQEQPTAFDVDKIISELKRDKFVESECILSDVHQGYNAGLNRAIEIVKGGGVDDN